MVRGSVYTATSLVRDYVGEEQFAVLAVLSELGRWSLYSKVLAALLSLPKSSP